MFGLFFSVRKSASCYSEKNNNTVAQAIRNERKCAVLFEQCLKTPLYSNSLDPEFGYMKVRIDNSSSCEAEWERCLRR